MRVLRVLGVFLLGTCLGLVASLPFAGTAASIIGPAVGGLVAGAATRKPALGALLGLAVALVQDAVFVAVLMAMTTAVNARAATHGMAPLPLPGALSGQWMMTAVTGAVAGGIGSYAWARIAQARAAKRRA